MASIRRLLATSSLTVSLLTLAACGGGGGDDGGGTPPASSRSAAEGAYAGSIAGNPSANAFELLVLEDGSYWSLYGFQSGSTLYVGGFVQGSGTAANGQFTSNNARDFGDLPAVAGSVTATYVPGVSISGTTSAAGGSASFSGTTAATAPYDYQQPANLADITGSWSLQTLSGEGLGVAIGANGSLSAVSSGGCRFSGTILPRPSGKNVFNVNIVFGAAPCLLASQSSAGIGVFIPSGPGRGQLTVLVTDGARSVGEVAFGAR